MSEETLCSAGQVANMTVAERLQMSVAQRPNFMQSTELMVYNNHVNSPYVIQCSGDIILHLCKDKGCPVTCQSVNKGR